MMTIKIKRNVFTVNGKRYPYPLSDEFHTDDGFSSFGEAEEKTRALVHDGLDQRVFIGVIDEWFVVNLNPKNAVCLCNSVFHVDERETYDTKQGKYISNPLFGLSVQDVPRNGKEKVPADIKDVFIRDFLKTKKIAVRNAQNVEPAKEDKNNALALFAFTTMSSGIQCDQDYTEEARLDLYFTEEGKTRVRQSDAYTYAKDQKDTVHRTRNKWSRIWNPFAEWCRSKEEIIKVSGKDVDVKVTGECVRCDNYILDNDSGPSVGSNVRNRNQGKDKPASKEPLREDLLKMAKASKSPLKEIFFRAVDRTGIYTLLAHTGSGKSHELVNEIALMMADEEFEARYLANEPDWTQNPQRPSFCVVSPLKSSLDQLQKDFEAQKMSVYRAVSSIDHLTSMLRRPNWQHGSADEYITASEFVDVYGLPPRYKESEILESLILSVKRNDSERVSSMYSAFCYEVRNDLIQEYGERYSPDILELDENQWIPKIFPDARIGECSVFLMTSKKFLVNITSPVMGKGESRVWYKYLDGRRGMGFIFDESDSVKKNLRDSLIESSVRNSATDLFGFAYFLTSHIVDACSDTAEGKKGALYRDAEEIDRQRRESDDQSRAGNGRSGRRVFTETVEFVRTTAEHLLQLFQTGPNMRYEFGDDLRDEDGQAKNIFLYHSGIVTQTVNHHDNLYILPENDVSYLSGKRKLTWMRGEKDEAPSSEKEEENLRERNVLHFVNETEWFAQKVYRSILMPLAGLVKNKVRHKTGEEISDESALSAVMDNFRFPDEVKEYFRVLSRTPELSRKMGEEQRNEASFYDVGLMSCRLSETAGATVKLYANTVRTTPELILLSLAEKHPVLLISATADSGSIMNFRLEYFRERLGEHYREATDEDMTRMAEYMQYQQLMKNVRYKAEPIHVQTRTRREIDVTLRDMVHGLFSGKPIDGCSDEEAAARAFDGEREIYDLLSYFDCSETGSDQDGDYFMARYLTLFESYRDQRLEGSDAILVFAQAGLKPENDDSRRDTVLELIRTGHYNRKLRKYEYNRYIVEECLHAIDQYYFGKALPSKVFTLLSQTKIEDAEIPDGFDLDREQSVFDRNLEKISGVYQQGHPVVIFTTYATAATSLNFWIYARDGEDLYHYNPHGIVDHGENTKRKKDLNGMIILKPTFVQLNAIDIHQTSIKNYRRYSENVIRRLYEIEEMSAVGGIDGKEKDRYITHMNNTDTTSIPYCCEVSRLIRQAAGRLMRNQWKNMVCNISYAEDLTDSLKNDYHGMTKEAPLMRCIYASILSDDVTVEETEKRNENTRCRKKISADARQHWVRVRSLVNGLNRAEENGRNTREDYDTAGRLVLEHGICLTAEEYMSLDKDGRSMYVRVPRGYTRLYYTQDQDYFNVTVYFTKVENQKTVEESDAGAMLPVYLRLPVVSAFFEENHLYMGASDNAEYMLAPIYYNNFYKGRLSETVTKLLIKDLLGYELQPVAKLLKYEKADFQIGLTAVDVKQYTRNTAEHVKVEEMYQKAANKTEEMDCDTCMFIMPVIRGYHTPTTGDGENQQVRAENGHIIRMTEIPGIYYIDDEGSLKLNKESLDVIRKEICYADRK